MHAAIAGKIGPDIAVEVAGAARLAAGPAAPHGVRVTAEIGHAVGADIGRRLRADIRADLIADERTVLAEDRRFVGIDGVAAVLGDERGVVAVLEGRIQRIGEGLHFRARRGEGGRARDRPAQIGALPDLVVDRGGRTALARDDAVEREIAAPVRLAGASAIVDGESALSHLQDAVVWIERTRRVDGEGREMRHVEAARRLHDVDVVVRHVDFEVEANGGHPRTVTDGHPAGELARQPAAIGEGRRGGRRQRVIGDSIGRQVHRRRSHRIVIGLDFGRETGGEIAFRRAVVPAADGDLLIAPEIGNLRIAAIRAVRAGIAVHKRGKRAAPVELDGRVLEECAIEGDHIRAVAERRLDCTAFGGRRRFARRV